jgi:hypothetical protein
LAIPGQDALQSLLTEIVDLVPPPPPTPSSTEVAVAKVAHSQKLRGQVSDEELRDEYRNEKALTIALMGLLAEESLIAQRLGKFGRKKAA